LIDIRGTLIRGVMAPFITTGSTELIRTGYEVGFGERGSMGFGCTTVLLDGKTGTKPSPDT
jgi:CRISPR-associated endoribonuclease Cas6